MKFVLNRQDQEQAFRNYVLNILAAWPEDEEMKVRMPMYSTDDAIVESVKKRPPEPQQTQQAAGVGVLPIDEF